MEWTNWYKTDNVVDGDDIVLNIDYKVNHDLKKDILDKWDFIDFINDFDCQTKVIKAREKLNLKLNMMIKM
jgi:hypothetical protein